MKALTALLFLLPLAAQDAPKLFYSKAFPGSVPAYSEIRLERSGAVEYREGPDEDDPITFTLSAAETETVFGLAAKLDHFNRPLESGLKVARMGDKTFRYIQGNKRFEAKFNYSADPDANTLLDWFERMCTSALLNAQLERAARYDRLGVNSALLKIEVQWDRKELLGPAQFLKMLDRIANSEAYISMARDRAAKLAAVFRQPAEPSTPSETKP